MVNLRKGKGYCLVAYFVYIFSFLLTEFTINERCVELLGANWVNPVYSIGLFCTALGYLSFGLWRKIINNPLVRKLSLWILSFMSLGTIVLFLYTTNFISYLMASFLSLVFWGHFGAYIHYILAMELYQDANKGKLVGLAIGIAVILQFLVQNMLVTKTAVLVSVVLCVIMMLYCIMSPFKFWIVEDPLPKEIQIEEKNTKKKSIVTILIITVLLMSVIHGLSDSIMTYMHANNTADIVSYSRLFYAMGALIAGWVADLQHRRFFTFVTACAMFISTIAIALLSSPASYGVSNSVLYFYSGFYVLYFTLVFLDYSPKAKNPALWAGMGRVVRSLTISVTLLPSMWLYQKTGLNSLIILGCVLSLLLLFFLYGNGMFFEKQTEEEKDNSKEKIEGISDEQLWKGFCETYGLTPREEEVARELLFTEDTTQQIADQLFVSRRVLQRNISSIYEKTNTKSRLGVYKEFVLYQNQIKV